MDEDENDLEDLFEEHEDISEHQEGDEDNNEGGNKPDPEAKQKIPAPRRAVKNPRLKFNAERLCGNRGIPVVVNHFKDVKFKGKGHEVEDLNKLLSTLEHWSHRLFPSMRFEDCLKQIEKLGKKRPVQTCLRKIRLDMPILSSDFIGENEEDDVQRHGMEDELDVEIPPQDAFDRLINELPSSSITQRVSTPVAIKTVPSEQRLGTTFGSSLTEEQKKRMEYNKLLATERRKSKLAAKQADFTDQSHGLSNKMQDPIFDIIGQTAKLINKHSDAANMFSVESLITKPSTAKENSEELALDDLVDLVDDDDPPPSKKFASENATTSSQNKTTRLSVQADLTNQSNEFDKTLNLTHDIFDQTTKLINRNSDAPNTFSVSSPIAKPSKKNSEELALVDLVDLVDDDPLTKEQLVNPQQKTASIIAMESVMENSTSQDIFNKNSTLDIFDQTTKLINRHSDAASMFSMESTIAGPSIVRDRSEELTLDDLVDLVDDDNSFTKEKSLNAMTNPHFKTTASTSSNESIITEPSIVKDGSELALEDLVDDENPPSNGKSTGQNSATNLQNKTIVGYVDLTDQADNQSKVKSIQVIDLEKEKIRSSSSLTCLNIIDLEAEPESNFQAAGNANKFVNVIDLEAEKFPISVSSTNPVEVVHLENEVDECDDLNMDTEDINDVVELQKSPVQNDVQFMDVE